MQWLLAMFTMMGVVVHTSQNAIANPSEPPVPAKKHEGVYNATVEGVGCPKPGNPYFSEDCLFLNVYTTKLTTDKENPKRPVIVYLSPGTLYKFGGQSNMEEPHYLMDQDVILVTFNWRLGIFGFISTGDKEAPGNNGLKDQVLALKWVKENIETFGGDPNSVTLFGYSSGGWSVTGHLISPMSQGLFHKAIVAGSSPLGQTPLGRNQSYLAKRQARAVGCADDTSANIMKCLNGKSTEELVNPIHKLSEFGIEPLRLFKPVIEEDFGQERFLTEHPIKLIRDGKFQKVPILFGSAAEGPASNAIAMFNNKELLQQLDKNWDKYAPIVFYYERYTDRSEAISRGLRSYYFGNNKLDDSSLPQMINLYNDAQSGFSINRAAKLLFEKNTQQVFYYRFNYKGRYSHFNSSGNSANGIGAVYYDELIYLLYNSAAFPKFEKTDPEYRMVQKMTTIWANFAKIGKPIGKTCGKFNYEEWEPFNLKTQKYMDIGGIMKMGENLYADRYEEWEKLIPLSQYNKIEYVSY